MTLDAALDSASGDNPALNMELTRRAFSNFTVLPVVPHKAVAEVSKMGNL